jgi:DNA polymerase-3 subunit chi
MTQVDFYILPDPGSEQRHLFAARLTEKVFKLGHKVYLHCQSEQQAKQIDKLLWDYQPSSFLPHQIARQDSEQQIEIGYSEDPGHHHDVMINLALTVPDFFSRFQRVTEIVVSDADITAATRANFKFYRDRGYALHSHDMRK